MEKNNKNMHNSKFIVPERFKAAKKKIEKITNEQFAEYVGVCLKQFQNYVNAKRPVQSDMLLKICARLNSSPEWITGESERDTGFSTEEEKALAALLPEYALQFALSDYIVESSKQSINPNREYVQVRGKRIKRSDHEILLNKLVAIIDFSVNQMIDMIPEIETEPIETEPDPQRRYDLPWTT